MTHDALIDRLRATPQSLRALVRGRPESVLTARDNDEGWTPLEVVAHLRASDAIISPRVYAVLTRDRPLLPALDERAFARLTSVAELPLDAQLAAFAITRAEFTGVLRTLNDAQWERSGIHEERGEITVAALCDWLGSHEAQHLDQIRAIVEAGRATGR